MSAALDRLKSLALLARSLSFYLSTESSYSFSSIIGTAEVPLVVFCLPVPGLLLISRFKLLDRSGILIVVVSSLI